MVNPTIFSDFQLREGGGSVRPDLLKVHKLFWLISLFDDKDDDTHNRYDIDIANDNECNDDDDNRVKGGEETKS